MITYDMRDLANESLYEYLYRKIREDILAGRLKKGERMPSKRSFAKNQGVAVITVENAYSQLVAEGYLYSEPRRGFFVSQIDESLRLPQTAPLKIESEEVKSAGDSIGEEAGLPGISGSEAVPAAAAGILILFFSRTRAGWAAPAIPALLAAHPGLPVHVGVGDKPFFGHPFNANPPAYPSVPPPATLAADLAEGMELSADGLMARVLATPGHTPGGVCFYFEAESLLVAGDTLFAGSAGRTDFPGGSARTLYASLARLKALPPETKVVCGHGPSTTIGRELLANPFFC